MRCSISGEGIGMRRTLSKVTPRDQCLGGDGILQGVLTPIEGTIPEQRGREVKDLFCRR